ncbi:MAG TPA: trigger factor, partial [Blastocatellia bacterium]|nr:trigger factor [Blastocatellia bacterium]
EEVKAQFDKAYDAYSRHVKVPGFRPGRVPRGVIKQRFSKEVKEEVVGQLLPHALEHAIVDNKLRMVGEPHINELSVTEGEPLKFKASIEVIPEVELKEYKGLKITKRVQRVTDEDVERMIERWRENAAELVPVEDRPSQNGDFVTVNLVGKYVQAEGQTAPAHEQEDLKAEDVVIELGGVGVQPEFNENLHGVKADDVREFRVVYPEDFTSKGLAGKTIDFTATVVSVKHKELPDLTDDFARDFGEYETLQAMRDKVREGLVKNAEQQANAALQGELLAQILKQYDFEVPSVMVQNQAQARVREFADMLLRSGLPPQSLNELNWDEQIKHAMVQAVQDVRSALVVSLIGEAEGVNVGQQEIDAEIELMASSTGESPQQLKARLTRDEAISSIENKLRYEKTLDAVAGYAEITVEEVTQEQLQNPQSQEDKQTIPEVQAAAE